ncbi:MAG: Na/Pi symporter [Christensenellaceae bacterium]|jgi:phosphate:Na+ symporter|nr:Na/Pi symporter [Christensenellaceae bacterium]
MEIFFGIVTFLVGLGVMLFGVKMTSEALERTTGSKFRNVITKATRNPFGAAGIGLGFTTILQSSTASMGLFAALCNAGVITLIQAVGIVFGVNVGAAVVHGLIVIGSLKVLKVLSLVIIVGMFVLLFSKSIKVKNFARLFVFIGLLFLGITIMSDGMGMLNDLHLFDGFANFISHPILIFLTFTVLTCLLQTSLGAFAVLISFLTAGIISVDLALWGAIGLNIGTALSSMLVTLGGTLTAKRMGMVHVLFNVVGAVVFSIMLACVPLLGTYMEQWVGSAMFAVLLFDIIFNIVIALTLIPLRKHVTNLAAAVFKEKQRRHHQSALPAVAEITAATAVPVMLNSLIDIYTKLSGHFFKSVECAFSDDEEEKKFIEDDVAKINSYTFEIEKTIMNVSSGVSEGDQAKLSKILDIVHKNRTIIRKIQKIIFFSLRAENHKKHFTRAQEKSIKEMTDKVLLISVASLTALRMFDSTAEFDRNALMVRVLELDSDVDKIKAQTREAATAALKNKTENAENFTIHNSMINAIDDISETFATIAMIAS